MHVDFHDPIGTTTVDLHNPNRLGVTFRDARGNYVTFYTDRVRAERLVAAFAEKPETVDG